MSSNMKEFRVQFQSFIEVMTHAIDERSPYNRDHTKNIAKLCGDFAEYLAEIFPSGHYLHFDEMHRECLVIAALLHDIGKIITPLPVMDKSDRLGNRLKSICYRFEIKKLQLQADYLDGSLSSRDYSGQIEYLNGAFSLIKSINYSPPLTEEQIASVQPLADITYCSGDNEMVPILDKEDMESLLIRKGTLTSEERAIMEEHVVLTKRLLDRIDFWEQYKDVPKWACAHHEFLDGTGYPNGLRGDEIPIESCIITILDIFDALTAKERAYRKPISVPEALDVLTEMAQEGKLHKELVALFRQSKVGEKAYVF